MSEPSAPPPLTTNAIGDLYRRAGRMIILELETALDSAKTLVTSDPLQDPTSTGQRLMFLKESQKRGQEISVQLLALLTQFREAQINETVHAQSQLKEAHKTLQLVMSSADPNANALLG